MGQSQQQWQIQGDPTLLQNLETVSLLWFSPCSCRPLYSGPVKEVGLIG